jgi:hypothetical protein
MKKYLPSIFFNAQEHYLIHQVEEIEKCGHVHTRSVWMVEKDLKLLEALVRQSTCSEGSMVEGYMVYKTMVYMTQYILKVAGSINVDKIQYVNSNINKFEGEHLLGKGRMRKVTCK